MDIKAKVFAADDLPSELVPCPEWGVSLTVRALDGDQSDAFEESSLDSSDLQNPRVKLAGQRARLVALSVVDPETGARVFSDDDVKALGKKSSAVLRRLYRVAARLSGIRTGEDEPEKNSGRTPAFS